jgi:hypothetical protein
MKTEYKEISVVSNPITFPCLRKSKESSLVVLFVNKNSGIVVNPSPNFTTNYFYSSFMNLDDNTVWAEVKGSVTFTSE